jgi:hypothetical protein
MQVEVQTRASYAIQKAALNDDSRRMVWDILSLADARVPSCPFSIRNSGNTLVPFCAPHSAETVNSNQLRQDCSPSG